MDDEERLSGDDITAIVTFNEGDPNENPWVKGTPRIEEIRIDDHSLEWAGLFATVRDQIAGVLPGVSLKIEHIGSTAVPGLSAKPIIDIDLIVKAPEYEESYVPALNTLGYELTIRERSWYQHRMLRLETPRVHLHVFAPDCPEHIRHVLFRNWLRDHADDRKRYAEAKFLAKNGVTTMMDYNRNKQSVIREIYHRIFKHQGWIVATP